MEQYRISVIIPVCNVEKFLRECLESVCNQTMKEIEIICVNDGSKDNSLQILQEYAAYDDRFVIIDKCNSGYGQSMNMGINIARGEYIAIVEPDDYIELNMFEELYAIAKENKLDFIKSNFVKFWGENASIITEEIKIVGVQSIYGHVIKPSINQNVFYGYVGNWTGLYRKAFLDEHKIRHNETPGASFQDQGYCFLVYAYADRGYFLDRTYYHYRQDNPNASMLNKNKTFCICDEYEYIYKKLQETPLLLEIIMPAFIRNKFVCYYDVMKRIVSEEREKFFEYFSKSMKEHVARNELDMSMLNQDERDRLQKILNGNIIPFKECKFFDEKKVLNSEKFYWIYGAGKYAERLWKKLDESSKKLVKGFLVSSVQENEGKKMPQKLEQYSKSIIDMEDIVLIALSEKYENDIIEKLERDNVSYLTYKDIIS